MSDREGAARVLVIDDDADLRGVIRQQLEAAGYEVAEAGSGKDALRILQSKPVDLVISDLFMPDMDGIEITMWLRDHRGATPLITMSGGGERHIDLLGLTEKLGARITLDKPFTREQLLAAVAQLA